MPKIYEYLGIVLYFYSNEHEPIHVHARKGEYESKAEIMVVNGRVNQIVITKVKGRKPLRGKDLSNLKTFLQHYADAVIIKWVNYFVYQNRIDFEKITKKL